MRFSLSKGNFMRYPKVPYEILISEGKFHEVSEKFLMRFSLVKESFMRYRRIPHEILIR